MVIVRVDLLDFAEDGVLWVFTFCSISFIYKNIYRLESIVISYRGPTVNPYLILGLSIILD